MCSLGSNTTLYIKGYQHFSNVGLIDNYLLFNVLTINATAIKITIVAIMVR
jgi:hypothetical protein